MINVRVESRDLGELERTFDSLNKSDQRKIVMASFRKAVKPLLTIARSNLSAHNKSWGVYRSMGTVEAPGELALEVGAITATKTMKKYKGRNLVEKVWYAHLLESGSWKTGIRHWKGRRLVRRGFSRGQYRGGNKSTGRMPATHFFENAYRQTESQIFSTISNDWYDSIEKFIKRRK
jgi:hypothetical protein